MCVEWQKEGWDQDSEFLKDMEELNNAAIEIGFFLFYPVPSGAEYYKYLQERTEHNKYLPGKNWVMKALARSNS